MPADSEFLSRLSKLRRLMVVKSLLRFSTAGLFLSLLSIVLLLAVDKLTSFDPGEYGLYLAAPLLALALAAVHTWNRKNSLIDELIDMDGRLDLNERLSTAYEYHQRRRESPFTDILVKEATNLIYGIERRDVFPFKFAPLHASIPVLGVLAIVLLSLDSPAGSTGRTPMDDPEIRQLGQRVAQYSKRAFKNADPEKDKTQRELSRKMEQLADELQKPTVSKQKALSSLKGALEDVTAQRIRTAERLSSQLGSGKVSKTPVLKPLRKDKATPNELKQLKKQLKKMFSKGIPNSLSREISNLSRQRQVEDFLEKTMNDVRLLPSGSHESTDASKEEGLLVERTSEKKTGNRKERSGKAGDGSAESAAKNRFGQNPSAGGKNAGKAGESERSAGDSDPDQTASAGRHKAAGSEKRPHELEKPKTPPRELKGASDQGEWYNVHIRSLTSIGRADVEAEEVVRSYRRDLENTLLKEDIPPNYRQFIKNYFLSIGLRKKKNEYENTR
ncbi:MAG: hypothetical protein GY866_10465 [Proteobacteria bacterium]|nr:hypothetical protein [Pseudomonadota bacterium]